MIWDWDYTWSILPEIFQGLAVTLEAVAGGMAIALVLGLAWAVCRRSQTRAVSWPAAGVVEFIRSTPLLVQLYFLFYVLPSLGLTLSPLATGVTALGLHYSCYTSEVYRAGINAIPRGQWEAARSLNLTAWQTYRHVILPQAIPPVVPALGNYLIAMFKDAPLL
ncbi:MAG: ectoine/hydroxyectoine ABC transporter permease subunit EhuD, partial [Planctomycetes bacterium]|nr:ectoine/hydroxyectoine ABC transporter permease subunit EhuD [Planctomycetota bacterium]